LHVDVRSALDQVSALGASAGDDWLILAHWVNTRARGLASDLVTAVLHAHLSGLDPKLVSECTKLFDRVLGGYAIDSWAGSRVQRLQRAMSRALRSDRSGEHG
jgi:hypothetical protein